MRPRSNGWTKANPGLEIFSRQIGEGWFVVQLRSTKKCADGRWLRWVCFLLEPNQMSWLELFFGKRPNSYDISHLIDWHKYRVGKMHEDNCKSLIDELFIHKNIPSCSVHSGSPIPMFVLHSELPHPHCSMIGPCPPPLFSSPFLPNHHRFRHVTFL